jgi:subtilisin family serine protease
MGWRHFRYTNDFDGTSAATPLVAGVAALLLSAQPGLTRDQLKDILRNSADKIGSDHDATTGHSNKFGYGRVNAEAALSKAKAMRKLGASPE